MTKSPGASRRVARCGEGGVDDVRTCAETSGLVLRIPKPFADEVKWEEGAVVEIERVGDALHIRPISSDDESLEEMLNRITDDNIHELIDKGEPQGKEIW